MVNDGPCDGLGFVSSDAMKIQEGKAQRKLPKNKSFHIVKTRGKREKIMKRVRKYLWVTS